MTSESTTTYRGVPWRREGDGTLSFYDREEERWVRWSRGSDAPPLPPGWEPEPRRRAGWRTPWRLVPVAIAIFIIVVSIFQTTRSPKRPPAPTLEVGQCLAERGLAGGLPVYDASPVSCASSKAVAKVVAELTGRGNGCPAGTTAIGIEARVVCLQQLVQTRQAPRG